MSQGIPCVATRVGGTAEIVSDGVNGLLVDPESPEALAHGIATLALDCERAQRLGRSAAATVRARFDLVTYVRGVLAAYSSNE